MWNEDEDTELRRRLAAFQADGLRRVDVIGDGNCFFRALAKQVNGDEQLHSRARQETSQCMREHREEFEQFVHSVDFDSYVDRMSREGTYVEGEIELMAAAKTFNVRIRVYGHSANHDRTFEPLECNLETRDVYMAHYQVAQHYVVLEPPQSRQRTEGHSPQSGKNRWAAESLPKSSFGAQDGSARLAALHAQLHAQRLGIYKT